MKYVYLLLLSALIFWETDSLQEIFEFSTVWQYLLNIVMFVYFAFLLNIPFPVRRIMDKVTAKD